MSRPIENALVKPGATVDKVISIIVTQIASGQLGPGEQLRQEDLAEALGVSRVPVREALHALAEQRVLVHLKHRGFFVAKRTADELVQLSRLLELIEDEVIRSLQWPDEETLAHLRRLNRTMLEVADDYDPAETFALNREFHFLMFGLSPLTLMTEELDRLWRLAQPVILTQMVTPEARRRRIAEHDAIIDRLVAHDREGVVDAMSAHRWRSGDPRAEILAAPATPTTGRALQIGPVEFIGATS